MPSSIATAGLSLFALAALFASTVPEPVSAHGLHEQRSSLGNTRRRHHARLAAQSKRYNEKRGDVSTLITGLGMGTLYFDVNGGGTCGPVNGWHSYAETNGYAMCEPNTGYKTLAQRGSNRVVAMPSNMLAGNQAKYCGKEVVVTYGDNTVENLVLWDGCASCNSNNGLDFSSTVFAEIFGESKCGAGRISGMSWKITSKQIWSYPDGNPVSGNDNNDDNEDDSAPAAPSADPTSSSSSTPLAPSSSSSASSQAWSESSSWVASSSSSSSSKDEAKPVGKPTNTKVAQVSAPTSTPAAETPAQTEDNDDEDAEDCDAEGDNDDDEDDGDQNATNNSNSGEPVDTASLPPVLVVLPKPTATSSSATVSSSQPPAESSVSPLPVPTAAEEAVEPADEPSAPAVVEQPAATPSPATSGNGLSTGDGGECNATPGAWKCVGRSLQQCVQNPGDWTWMTRVECKVDIINCDSPNPVCASY